MAGVVELSCVKTGGFSACVTRYGFLTQTSLTLEIAVYLTEAGCHYQYADGPGKQAITLFTMLSRPSTCRRSRN